MYFQVLLEWIFVDLDRFDLCKVVLDVDVILVADDGNQEFLVVLEEGVATESCWDLLLRGDVHIDYKRFVR